MSAAEYQRFLARMAQKVSPRRPAGDERARAIQFIIYLNNSCLRLQGVNIDALIRYQRTRGDFDDDRDDDRDREPEGEGEDEDGLEYAEETKNDPPALAATAAAAAAARRGAEAAADGGFPPSAAGRDGPDGPPDGPPDASPAQLPRIRGATPTRPGTASSSAGPVPTLDSIAGGLFRDPPRPASASAGGSARMGKQNRHHDDLSVAGSTVSAGGGGGGGSARRPSTSGGVRPTSGGWLKVRLWPAWNCCIYPCRPSHPGTPTRLSASSRCTAPVRARARAPVRARVRGRSRSKRGPSGRRSGQPLPPRRAHPLRPPRGAPRPRA